MPKVGKMLMNCQVKIYVVYIDLRIDKILPEPLKNVYLFTKQLNFSVVKHLSIITWFSITHIVKMTRLKYVKCFIYVKIHEK